MWLWFFLVFFGFFLASLASLQLRGRIWFHFSDASICNADLGRRHAEK